MKDNLIRQGVPLRQVKVKKAYSTFKGEAISLAVCAFTAIGLKVLLALLGVTRSNGLQSPVPFAAGLLGCYLLYLLIYKRGNCKFVAEDGLYFVKRGYAVFVPWKMVKGVKISSDGIGFYMEIALYDGLMDEATNTKVTLDAWDCLLPYSRKAEECFLRHVPVTGDEKWEKRRRKRVGHTGA